MSNARTQLYIAACLTASNEMLYRRAGGAITTMFQTKFTILIHTDIHPYRKDYNPSPGLGEEDDGGERGSGLGGYDHGGRTWERCGYGGGGRYALDIAPFKKCPKCFPGHIERDCKVTPCFRCMGFGHMAMDCKGIPCFRCRGILYCGGVGRNVSSSGSWVGQPPIQ